MAALSGEGGTYYVEGVSPGEGGTFQEAFDDALRKLQEDSEYDEVRQRALRNPEGLIRLHVTEMYVRVRNPIHDYRIVFGIDT